MGWIVLLLACGWTTPEVPQAEPPAPQVALAAEREALHAAERALLAREAGARLSASDLEGALTPLLAAERLGGLPEQVDRALALAEERDPGLAAQLHGALAEAVRGDPSRALRHATAARTLEAVAEIRGRYGGEATANGLARTRGITRPMLDAAVGRAVEGHVGAPKPVDLAQAGARRLLALAESPGPRRRFPESRLWPVRRGWRPVPGRPS